MSSAIGRSPPKATLLRGHGAPVLCVACRATLIASSSEDGALILWRVSRDAAAGLRAEQSYSGRFDRAPAAALAFHGSDSSRLFAGCERAVVEKRALTAQGSAGAAADGEVLLVTCADEVSALSAHPTQPLLTVADDSGSITIVDTAARAPIRVLSTKGHESLATAILTAPPAAWIAPGVALPTAWALSGGCDTRCLLWDAGAAGERGPLSSLAPGSTAAEADAEAGVVDATTSINPPYVHAFAWGPLPPDSTGAAARGAAPAALAAAALGDGRVALISVVAPADGGVRRGRPAPRLGSGASLALHWAAKAHPSAVCAVAVVDSGEIDDGACEESGRESVVVDSDFEDFGAAPTVPRVTRHTLVSSSNDGTFCVWDWGAITTGESGNTAVPVQKWVHTHGRVNVLAGGLGFVAVATTRKSLILYEL
jgi:hypothetical protein